jgi:hypothetical protein
VPQTQVSNKLEATSLLTPARAIQLPSGYVKNFRHCNCYRDYIAVDESAYGCPYVHAYELSSSWTAITCSLT